MSIVKHKWQTITNSTGKKSLWELLRSGVGPWLLFDGNLWETVFHQTADGKLIGEDKLGNKYYENKTYGYTRSRWVVYANKFDYNASSVPSEWHGWLNYVNDFAPPEYKYVKPIYEVEHYPTRTGTYACYNPKGSWFNPKQRNWKKYEDWKPPQPKA